MRLLHEMCVGNILLRELAGLGDTDGCEYGALFCIVESNVSINGAKSTEMK